MSSAGIKKIAAGGGLLTLLIWGFVFSTIQVGGKTRTVSFRMKSLAKTDTTDPSPIEAKPCNSYSWFQPNEGNWESEGYAGGIGGSALSSLHEMTCKWAAYQHGLSLDSTRLSKYVRPTGDTLQLEDGILAYAVEMVQLKDGPTSTPHKLYFVAEVRDSLYYREIDTAAPHHGGSFSSNLRVRSLRLLDVPKAETQYIWFEYARFGDKERNGQSATWEEWKAHIFTYDRRRGFRHLQWVPIREEERQNGELVGAKQWDVSVPEAGFMRVEKRLQKGKDLTLEPPEHWLGLHVIDSSAAGTESVRPSRD